MRKSALALFILMSTFCHAEPLKYPILSDLDGVKSLYTDLLVEIIKSWTPGRIQLPADHYPVQIKCLSTKDKKYYIGAVQKMTINSSLGEVVKILDDFSNYENLFPDLESVKVLTKESNRAQLLFEQNVPVFFIPNVKFEMTYLIDKSKEDRAIYRYKLKTSQSLKFSDGIIILDQISPNQIEYTELDFFDADWGALETFGPGRIWQDSIDSIFLSDYAIKLKAEHLDWSNEKAKKEAKSFLKKNPIESIVNAKREPADQYLKSYTTPIKNFGNNLKPSSTPQPQIHSH